MNKEIEEVKELRQAITELHRSNDLMHSNFENIKDNLGEVKYELKNITTILQTQVVHAEKIHQVEEKLKTHESCVTSSASRDESIKHLTKDLDSVRGDLKKVVFVLISAIVGGLVRFYMTHTPTP